MTTQHTPGPWEWKFDGKYCVGLEPNVIWVGREPTLDIEAANARLIAAAPDLLAALQTLMDLIELRGPRSIAPHKSPIEELRATLTKADYEAARAAIAKAKGG